MSRTHVIVFAVVAIGLLAAGCPGDDAEACDPNVVGTICTIAGSGENGYDRDADTRAIPALQA